MTSRITRTFAVALAAGSAFSAASAQSIATLPPNNGSGGIFLQLTPAAGPLTVTSFSSYFSSAAGTPVSVEVWTRPGAYAGFTASNAGWTLSETVVGTSAGTVTESGPVVLANPIVIPSGGPTSIYLHAITAGGGIRYQGTGTTSTGTFINADVTLFSDISRTGALSFGGTQFTPRAFSGTINYTLGGTLGACCLTSGPSNCVVTTSLGCTNQGGTYQGDGSTCTGQCPPLPTGACCLQFGGCSVMTQFACTSGGGTYGGDNVACATANCTPNGRCCFSDGSCLVMTSALCTTAGGTYGGDNSTCTTAACTQQAGNIACNGPFVTSPTGACIPVGSFHSEVQAGNTIAGFNQSSTAAAPGPFRIADDFSVPSGETWTVNGFTFYGYQTGVIPPTSTFLTSTCQVWDGRPGDVGSTVVAGDTITNVLTSSVFTEVYRTFNAACDLTRAVFANTVTLTAPAVLSAGTYWVDFDASGSAASGPWALNVTVTGLASPPGANARQFATTWGDLLDGANVQEAAFCIRGSVAGGGCYANCDGSVGNPLLTANDFSCFLNKYVNGDTYADCDGVGGLTANDFSCFLGKYVAGCS